MNIVKESVLSDGWTSPDMQKLISSLIRKYTRKGAVVLDPFCGTGTVALLADKLGRKGYCCDISAKYEAIAKKRGVKRVHRCNAAKLHAYPNNSVDLILTSPPTFKHKEKYDVDEPDIDTVIEDFIKEAKRILKGDRIIIIGVKEDAIKYHALCKKNGLKLTFIALPMSLKALEGFN